MFLYPKQTEFNRPLSKTRIFSFARPGRAVRDRFASEVNDIVWKYKLSPETINLPARQSVQEIQVFVINLRKQDLAETVLQTIDKAIPSLIFFELALQDRVRFIAAYKRPNDADPSKSVVEAYFGTPWQRADAPRVPLPVALDLAGLYEQMLRRLMPVAARPGESLKSHVERASQIQAKEKECRKLETRLNREIQFNRKVELNAALRLRRTELNELQQI